MPSRQHAALPAAGITDLEVAQAQHDQAIDAILQQRNVGAAAVSSSDPPPLRVQATPTGSQASKRQKRTIQDSDSD